MIEAQDLCRRYADFKAVDGVSFAVQEGEILGILGPNGAGKTTTIRMITGFLPPSSGRVTVAGQDLWGEGGGAARRQIGYLPENVALYPEMRVEEYLRYRARLEGVERARVSGALDETLRACLLTEVRRQIIGTLSKGYRQRVALAAAILHEPKVLVLDEPTVGLDPKQIIAVRDLIRDLGHRRTLLLSTHILPEVELLCDRVLIIDGGRIVAQGTPASLQREWAGKTIVHVGFEGDPDGAGSALAALEGVAAVEPDGASPGRFRLECGREADPRSAVFRLAVERGWALVELAQEKASLEDLFVRLTTQESREAAPVASPDQTSDQTPAPAEEVAP